MKIQIEFIDSEDQRYKTCGDYFIDQDGNWQIKVSNMINAKSMMAVAVHELVEMILVVNRSIPMEAIDKFDIRYEQNRIPGDDSEPGDSVKAPYHEEHTFSTSIERMLCEALGLSWKEHGDAVQTVD